MTQSQSPQLKYLNNIVEQDHRAIKRSNHVVTLAAKAITIRYYGNPMQHSYMTGCSKGGQAVLLEAQRFPNDYIILAGPRLATRSESGLRRCSSESARRRTVSGWPAYRTS